MQNNINWHNVRMIAGLVILAVIGAIQALHGAFPGSGALDTAVPVLLALEHAVEGNTSNVL